MLKFYLLPHFPIPNADALWNVTQQAQDALSTKPVRVIVRELPNTSFQKARKVVSVLNLFEQSTSM